MLYPLSYGSSLLYPNLFARSGNGCEAVPSFSRIR